MGRSCVRKTGSFLRERQQRIAFGAAHAAPRVLAEEEDDESEDQTEADREGEWNDGHGGNNRTGSGHRRGLGDLRCATPRLGIAAVAVAEHLLRGMPVLEVSALRSAIFDPQHVGGMLNLGLSGFRRGPFGGELAFHGGWVIGMKHSKPKQELPLRAGWPTLCISCHAHRWPVG